MTEQLSGRQTDGGNTEVLVHRHYKPIVKVMLKKTQTANCMLIASSLILLCLSAGCNHQEPEEIVRPVQWARVEARTSGFTRTFSGVSQASVRSELSFRVGGTIERIAVDEGDPVSSGQILAELEKEDFRLKIKEAEAALAKAKAQARNAQANYTRAKRLYEQNNISLNELDVARAEAESAQANVDVAQTALRLAERRFEYTTMKANREGWVTRIHAEENENISSGQPVMTLVSGEKMEVQIGIPEDLIGSVKKGQQAAVEFEAWPEREYEGEVTEVGVTVGRTATTFPVAVTLKKSDTKVRLGMAADVTLYFAGKRTAFLVPAIAVGEDINGKFVYVLEEKNNGYAIATRRKVITGRLTEEGLEVLSGLERGERIITHGVTRISDGEKVRMLREK
ncbi:Multidrug transporter MdtA [Anaerohalosphaera lusitana]|uniref:Multidrug transporter MdtA n=1 Tax=Anaerohalosphaera lusitana TaxID=1936003 RepID=A0A1U9NNY4_9BACT|nr:efflux RND transporter periplasmic adaptor subunit [Anaerohalosphaera lusitana]AQT69428.1 Multidrug transporter MdtA [Anaerohalosphaera lusitana]